MRILLIRHFRLFQCLEPVRLSESQHEDMTSRQETSQLPLGAFIAITLFKEYLKKKMRWLASFLSPCLETSPKVEQKLSRPAREVMSMKRTE